MSKLIERLAKKIKEDLGVDVDPKPFISIRPKKWDKLMGTWSWSMQTRTSELRHVGSIYTATECASKKVKLFQAGPHPGCWPNDIDVVPEEL